MSDKRYCVTFTPSVADQRPGHLTTTAPSVMDAVRQVQDYLDEWEPEREVMSVYEHVLYVGPEW